MPSASEIRAQTARELERRKRLAVPAFAGGVLYLLSAIVIASTLSGAPTVGLLQGLEPALHGEVNPARSPRTDEVKFISHHAFGLIAGSTLAALAIGALTLVLLLLVDATAFRRPGLWRGARPLVLYGGIAFAVVSLGHQIVGAIETHKFAVGHDFSNHAVDQALTKGALNTIVVYLALISAVALAGGTIVVSLNAQRVGLIPRWMGVLGVFTGVLIFLPIGGAQLQIVPAFWLVMMGILYMGRWSKGDPPAWAAGEARPWPSAAQARAERQSGEQPDGRSRGRGAAKGGAGAKGGDAAAAKGSDAAAKGGEAAGNGGDVAPAPTQPAEAGSSRKRRRKRKARN